MLHAIKGCGMGVACYANLLKIDAARTILNALDVTAAELSILHEIRLVFPLKRAVCYAADHVIAARQFIVLLLYGGVTGRWGVVLGVIHRSVCLIKAP